MLGSISEVTKAASLSISSNLLAMRVMIQAGLNFLSGYGQRVPIKNPKQSNGWDGKKTATGKAYIFLTISTREIFKEV